VARTLEQKLAALRTLDPHTPKALDELRAALQSQIGILVASAAKLVAEHTLEALVPELPLAFERLLEQPAKRDPGCRGKVAIVRALHTLDSWDDRVFVAGLTHVQREGWAGPDGGEPDDTAAELRGLCGLAHAHFARGDALDVLATLLADPERTTRIGAAQALGDAGRPDASALLRYKLLSGVDEAEVLAACVEALMSLAPEASYPFVVGFLAEHDDRAEVAAISLGGARRAEAFEPLTSWCIGASPEQRHRVGYLAIALLRCDPANEYLLDAIRSHGRADAVAAARALATFKDDAAVAARIRDAANDQKDKLARRDIDELLSE
jgi:hypothetical protein